MRTPPTVWKYSDKKSVHIRTARVQNTDVISRIIRFENPTEFRICRGAHRTRRTNVFRRFGSSDRIDPRGDAKEKRKKKTKIEKRKIRNDLSVSGVRRAGIYGRARIDIFLPEFPVYPLCKLFGLGTTQGKLDLRYFWRLYMCHACLTDAYSVIPSFFFFFSSFPLSAYNMFCCPLTRFRTPHAIVCTGAPGVESIERRAKGVQI